MPIDYKETGPGRAAYPYYANVPALNGARFAFIEEALWAAGMQWARKRHHRSKASFDLDVLFGVTRLVHIREIIVREATDKSVMLTATASYLRSVGKARGNLIRISMSDIRRAEQNAGGGRYVGRH
jgi:hypothetical protein